MLEVLVRATLALVAPAASAAPVAECLTTAAPVDRWTLPPALREVSGLALTDDGRLLMHNDEIGAVGVLDAASGKVLGSYTLGRVPPRGDFEGIAVAGRRVFLTTSDGVLYQAELPDRSVPSGALVPSAVATGIGKQCEVEGLAWDPTDSTLLFACKAPRAKALGRDVAVFRWSVAGGAPASGTPTVLSRDELGKGRPGRNFHPSAIEIDRRTGDWILLASADGAIARASRTGEVVATGALPKRHQQSEGLAIDGDGRVFVSDEGRNGAGTITVYDCR